jgi:hypothetical protein
MCRTFCSHHCAPTCPVCSEAERSRWVAAISAAIACRGLLGLPQRRVSAIPEDDLASSDATGDPISGMQLRYRLSTGSEQEDNAAGAEGGQAATAGWLPPSTRQPLARSVSMPGPAGPAPSSARSPSPVQRSLASLVGGGMEGGFRPATAPVTAPAVVSPRPILRSSPRVPALGGAIDAVPQIAPGSRSQTRATVSFAEPSSSASAPSAVSSHSSTSTSASVPVAPPANFAEPPRLPDQPYGALLAAKLQELRRRVSCEKSVIVWRLHVFWRPISLTPAFILSPFRRLSWMIRGPRTGPAMGSPAILQMTGLRAAEAVASSTFPSAL